MQRLLQLLLRPMLRPLKVTFSRGSKSWQCWRWCTGGASWIEQCVQSSVRQGKKGRQAGTTDKAQEASARHKWQYNSHHVRGINLTETIFNWPKLTSITTAKRSVLRCSMQKCACVKKWLTLRGAKTHLPTTKLQAENGHTFQEHTLFRVAEKFQPRQGNREK